MKKIIYIILILFVLSTFVMKEEKILVPEESIRFRIIANSNDTADQAIKMNIKSELENNIFKLVANSKSKEETKKIILDNQDIIEETLDKYNVDYNISYGNNYFPTKTYKGVEYSAGDYESLVISLGEAEGNNWWCVMYPPLCLLESNENEYEEVEYKSYIQEIIEKITS